MRLLEPLLLTVFKGQIPILLIAGSLLKVFRSHQVQLGGCRQFCVVRRLLSGFLSDPISCPLFRSSAVGCAMSIECGHTTDHERRDRHHHKETQWFKFSRHDSARQSSAVLGNKVEIVNLVWSL